jgi:hypothetical protein
MGLPREDWMKIFLLEVPGHPRHVHLAPLRHRGVLLHSNTATRLVLLWESDLSLLMRPSIVTDNGTSGLVTPPSETQRCQR